MKFLAPPPSTDPEGYEAKPAPKRGKKQLLATPPVTTELGGYTSVEGSAEPEHRSAGRPEIYTQELADKIIGRVEAGESISTVIRDHGMPSKTTLWCRWMKDESTGFRERYETAFQKGLSAMAADINDIADLGAAGDPARASLMVRTRLRILGVYRPEWREAKNVNMSGNVAFTAQRESIDLGKLPKDTVNLLANTLRLVRDQQERAVIEGEAEDVTDAA